MATKDNQKLGFKRTHYPWLYEIPAEFDGKIKTPGILLLALLSCLLLPAPSLGLTLAQKLAGDIPYDGSQPALYGVVLFVVLSTGRH